MFGVINTVATLDHLDPPQPPKCITMLYVFAETYVRPWHACGAAAVGGILTVPSVVSGTSTEASMTGCASECRGPAPAAGPSRF